MKYFAYGSNCSEAVMARKKVPFNDRRRAVLQGFRLRFNKKALRKGVPDEIAFANIEPDDDGVVEGILYDLEDEHLARLDASERFPDHYDRVPITVEAAGEDFECCTYRALPDKTAEGLVPSRNYLNHILTARDFLSLQYFEALDQTRTYRGECSCCGGEAEAIFIRETHGLSMVCQPCREARLTWGDVLGRKLTVAEAAQVMTGVVASGERFGSVTEVVAEAVRRKLIQP